MKRKLHFLYLALVLLMGLPTLAQQTIVANEDVALLTNGNAQTVILNVMANDSINFDHANLTNVSLSQISTDSPLLQLQPDGSVVITANSLPTGAYSLVYMLCNLDIADECATGNVTVFINVCQADTPVIGVTDPMYCNQATTSFSIYNLPSASTWTLRKTKDNVFVTDIVGQGETALISVDSPGIYGFQVINDGNGCMSSKVSTQIYSIPCHFDVYINNSTYQDFNTNGLVDPGDVINYTFRFINTTPVTYNNITLTSTSINISGGPLAVLGPNTTNVNNTFTGVHVITQADIDANGVSASVTATAASPAITDNGGNWFPFANPRGIRLLAFADTNNNGIWNTGEVAMPHYGQFRIEKNNDGNTYYSHGNNRVIYENNPANSYDLGYEVNGDYAPYYTVTTTDYQDVTAPASGFSTYIFAAAPTPFNDTRIKMYAYGNPRAGFPYRNIIIYENMSNVPVASGTVAFVKDDTLSITSISQSGTTPTASGFTYTFTNLGPYESRTIVVDMSVPPIPTVTLGDQITNTATLSLEPADIIPTNNTQSLTATIMGSYDPNDKTEAHGGKIVAQDFSTQEYLTYTIRFENTGTAHALNVKIVDALDDRLDETSVRLVTSSWPCVMKRLNSELTWEFNGINLPPSVEGTETGHGYVVFEVKPKPGYAVGDIIPNSADIYFDFNPAIVTEPCVTEFVTTLGLKEFSDNRISVYPNPATDLLSISAAQPIDEVWIYSVLGQIVLNKSIRDKNALIDVSRLQAGAYFLKMQTGESVETVKIVKK